MMDESTEMDPSLPLNDDSLTPQGQGVDTQKGEGQESPVLYIDPAKNIVQMHITPPSQTKQRVRFTDTPLTPPKDGRPLSPCVLGVPGPVTAGGSVLEDSPAMTSWQVDGSNHSIVSNSINEHGVSRGLTMKDYEEQLTTLRKENFNLKLRIYFLEENKGLFSGPVEQENLYRINIDLKVRGEELKRELEENKALVNEASKGLQSIEDKYKQEVDQLKSQLAYSEAEKKATNQRSADLECQLSQLIESTAAQTKSAVDNNKGPLSEESRILYSDAFGSFANDSRMDANSENNMENQTAIENLKEEVTQLSKELDNKIEENFYLVQQKDEIQKNLDEAINEKNDSENKLSEAMDENDQLKAEKDGIANRLEKEIETISRIEKLAQQMKLDIAIKDKEIGELKNMIPNKKNNSKLEDTIFKLEKERDSNLATIIELKRKVFDLNNELKDTETNHQAKIDECNGQVSRLESELNKRNQEVCSFLNLIKRLQKNPQFMLMKKQANTEDNLINNDFIDLDDLTAKAENIDVVISESKEALEELIENCSRVSPEIEQHLEYELNRNAELEQILRATEDKLVEKDEYIEQMEKTVLDIEMEKNQLIAKLERKSADLKAKEEELRQLKETLTKIQASVDSMKNTGTAVVQENVSKLEEKLALSEANLKKSHLCIQGFATENLKLSTKVKELNTQTKYLTALEKSRVMKHGIDKATQEFSRTLATYRERYDRLRSCIKNRDEVCHMLRQRLEEITHFLVQLLESGDDTLNISSMSIELKDQIQNSIEQSLLLTASILNGSSILTDDLGAQGTDNEEEIFDDEWIVPDVSLSFTQHDGGDLYQMERRYSEGGEKNKLYKSSSLLSLPARLNLPQASAIPLVGEENKNDNFHGVETRSIHKEYEELLVDLRDALRRRKEAEEKLSSKENELILIKQNYDEAVQKLENMERSKNGKQDLSFVFTRPKTPLGFIEDLPTANFVSPVVVAQHGSSMSAAKDSVSNATTQLSFASPSADKRSRIPVRKGHSQKSAKSPRSSSVPSRLTTDNSQAEKSSNQSMKTADKLSNYDGVYKKMIGLPKPFFKENATLSLKITQKDKIGTLDKNDEDDSFSEPDKEESRRRIGIDVVSDRESFGRRSLQNRNFNSRTDDDYVENIGSKDPEKSILHEKAKKLAVQVDKLKVQISDVEKAKDNLEVANYQLEADKKNFEKKLSKAQSNLDTAKNHITDLMTELKKVKQTNVRQSSELDSLKSVQQHQSEQEENQNRINELEVAVKGRDQKILELKSETQEMELRYRKEKSEAIVQLDNARQQLAVINKEKQSLEKTLNTFRNHVASLEKERDEMGRTLSNLRSQVAKLEEKKLMTESLEMEYNALAREKKSCESEIVNLKASITKLQEDSKTKQLLQTEVSKLLAEKHDTKSAHEKSVNILNNQIETLTHKISVITKEKTRLEHGKSVSEELCTEYKNKYVQLREQYDTYQTNLETLRAELATKERIVKSVEEKISVKENEIDALKDDLEKQQSHELKYRNKWLESEKIVKTLKEKLKQTHTKQTTKITTEELIWSEKLSEENEYETIDDSSQYRVTSQNLSKLGKKSQRRPLSTLDANSGTNQHFFGAKATPELQLGKLGSFLDTELYKSGDHEKENNDAIVSRQNLSKIGAKLQFGAFSTAVDKDVIFGDGYCCNAATKLRLTEKELEEARLRLKNTQDELQRAADKISISNRRKKRMESAIVKELTKTRTVLKKANSNLESCASDS